MGLEEPEIKLTRAQEDVVGVLIKDKRSETILWTVTDFVKNSLNADVGSDIPNSYYFVCAEGDQVISIFIKSQILDTCGMAIKVTESVTSKWIPHDDVSLFTTTCHKSMLG